MRPPCYGCNERRIGCHGGCAAYKAFKESRFAAMERRDADKLARTMEYESIMRGKRK